MEILQLSHRVWTLHGAVNMGLVQTMEGWVAVDTGLDKQAAKALLKHMAQSEQKLLAIINTHAHADHYGGNAYLLKQQTAPVYAPVFESSVMQRPHLEPEYLWQGAKPFPDLLNKFLLAEPSPVDVEFEPGETLAIGGLGFETVALPGHSFGQVGVVVEGIFFAADSYFAQDVIEKHGLPYLVDYPQTLTRANAAARVEADWYVPGHGAPEKNPNDAVEKLIERHQQGLAATIGVISRGPLQLGDIVSLVCAKFDLQPSTPGAWVLLRTTISAYLTAALEAGQVRTQVVDGRLWFILV